MQYSPRLSGQLAGEQFPCCYLLLYLSIHPCWIFASLVTLGGKNWCHLKSGSWCCSVCWEGCPSSWGAPLGCGKRLLEEQEGKLVCANQGAPHKLQGNWYLYMCLFWQLTFMSRQKWDIHQAVAQMWNNSVRCQQPLKSYSFYSREKLFLLL